MHRPIVIIEPLSSGTALAPAFKKHNIPTIAVRFHSANRQGFGSKIITEDFDIIIPYQENLSEILKQYRPYAIIPGTWEAVPLADKLSTLLTPDYANDPGKSLHRLHKALMQQALKEAGVPTLETLNTSSEVEAEKWIKENHLSNTPLIVKPPMSAGSDKVFHIPAKEDWRKAFRRVLTEPDPITKNRNETAIIQEQAIGDEFAVGTVSANGKHYLSHLIKYNKTSCNERKTVFDYVEFVPYQIEQHAELLDYNNKALDALGIRWGAAHNEIILTKQGPRLIESNARIIGGPVAEFTREASGSSQIDNLVALYAFGKLQSTQYDFKKTVVPVFLSAPAKGVLLNAEVFEEAAKLSTFFKQYIWYKNGDQVPLTVDYLTSMGIISLAGDRESIFLDYQRIRHMEQKIRIGAT